MNRYFAPMFSEYQLVYPDTSRHDLYSYAPIPRQVHQRDSEGGGLVIQSKLLRIRRQAVRNLVWLPTPWAHDAPEVIDNDSPDVRLRAIHPWLRKRYSAFSSLSKRFMRFCLKWLLLSDTARSASAAEFWQHSTRGDGFIAEVRRVAGDQGVESMDARVVAQEDITMVNPPRHRMHADPMVWVRDVQRTIDGNYESRCASLNKAGEFLRSYFERCRFSSSRSVVGMDNPSGVWQGGSHPDSIGTGGCRSDFIGTSPALIGTPIALVTLIHEIARGTAGPVLGHYKPFWDICLRFGLRKTYIGRFAPALKKQFEGIKDAHGLFPVAVCREAYVWRNQFLET